MAEKLILVVQYVKQFIHTSNNNYTKSYYRNNKSENNINTYMQAKII